MRTDFIASDHGSIVLLLPCSPAAREWVKDFLPDDALYFGRAVAVERRFFGDIYDGIRQDQLTIA